MTEPALYLIPTTLGATPAEQVFPNVNREIIIKIKYFIVEEVRTARRFLKFIDKSINIDELTFMPMGKHADAQLYSHYLEPLAKGNSIGMLSEAGCPAVADPGSIIVGMAQKQNFRVVPLVGPSSIILALMASGMNGQNFAFNGYLPIGDGERDRALKTLQTRAIKDGQTQLFIETPFRNPKMIATLLRVLDANTRLCIAANVTCEDEYIKTKTVAQWKHEQIKDLSRTPAIFCIGK